MIDQFSGTTFLDFGCRLGNMTQLFERLFPGEKGMGIDMRDKFVDEARERGIQAVVGDITKLELEEECVRFVTMGHILEHLHSYEDAKEVIDTAIHASRDFIFIRQPNFDDDAYLMDFGLKFNFSDWPVHPNRMSCLELFNILSAAKKSERISRFVIGYTGRIGSSHHRNIHSLYSPPGSQLYDATIHPTKPNVEFDKIVYFEIMAIVAKSDPGLVDLILEKIGCDVVKYDSNCSDTADERVEAQNN